MINPFGIYKWKNVVFCLQEITYSFPANIPSPVEVQGVCPFKIIPKDHKIDLLKYRKVTRLFLPIKHKKVKIYKLNCSRAGVALRRMLEICGIKETSPHLFPLWSYKPKPKDFEIVNNIPIVFFDGTNRDQNTIDKILSYASVGNRNVIFAGDSSMFIPADAEYTWSKSVPTNCKEIGEQALWNQLRNVSP